MESVALHPEYAALQAWWAANLGRVDPILALNNVDALWWSFDLFGDGAVQDQDELNQTISIICTTPQGSDPHRPTFSSGLRNYIDYPISRATPYVVRESSQAIVTWEPRLTLDTVSVLPYNPGIAGISVKAEWSIAGFTGSTEVQVG